MRRQPDTAAGRALLADPFRHVMSCPAYKRQDAECSCVVGQSVLAIEAEARLGALDVERLAAVLPGLLNFRCFVIPRPVGDPFWDELAKDLLARLRVKEPQP